MIRARMTAFLLATRFLVGCAGMTPQAREIIWNPTNCEDAANNIRTLESNRPSGGGRFVHFVQAVLPPAIVISALRDIFWGKPFRSIYFDHWRIAFGSYGKRIDSRVDDLQRCTG